MQKHVFAGMSGGIDSSASVKLLLEQGYKVTGITFVGLGAENKPRGKDAFIAKPSRKCCSVEEILSAKEVCYTLGIDHVTLDLAEIFKKKVRDYFTESYQKGETPNPCMMCNRYVKLGALIEHALSEGADYVAMGHYTGLEIVDGEHLLKAGRDKNKDQSYFLALLKPEYLPHLLFPFADKSKDEIRDIVQNSDIPLSKDKAESQDVCFVDGDYRDYLRDEGVPARKGEMILDGGIAAEHDGAAFYALGQRRGLGGAFGRRVFVREIDASANRLILGDKPRSHTFSVTDLNIFSKHFGEGDWDVQIRYRSPRTNGSVRFLEDGSLEVVLDEAQDIVTPGQYAVFYKDDYIYAAGRIHKTSLLP